MSREAMTLALEALEHHTAIKHPQQRHYRDAAIDALRAALAQEDKNDFHPDWDTVKAYEDKFDEMLDEIQQLRSELKEKNT